VTDDGNRRGHSVTDDECIARAHAFLADDPDPDTRAELQALLAARDLTELRDRFGEQLAFGTAGLRGLIGAGDNRMNRRVVARTSAGLCAYLAERIPSAAVRGICLGFDGRHKSRHFADEVRAIASGAGFTVYMFDEVCPTPLLAFAVRDVAAVGGVMITASHNPAAYNGYKVYLDDGAQLRRPHDLGLARAIAQIGSVASLPRGDRSRSLAGVEARYLAGLSTSLAELSPRAVNPRFHVAYSAMHGVGSKLARAALKLAGVGTLHEVAIQAEPDPDFPTVAFPNPEEPGAIDRLLALSNEVHADLAIANDPDADRLALAAPAADGGGRALTGNEIGLLLTDHLLANAPRDGKNLIVSTIVSSPMVERIARAHGARFETTLTGFKWIMERTLELEATGLRLVLGFEEALGYCVGDLVRDKDGIAAAAHAARMASAHAAQGRTLHDALERLYRAHGLFASRPLSIDLPGRDGLAQIAACMARLRGDLPRSIADRAVTRAIDLQGETDLPKGDVVIFQLEDASRIAIRPSGTEPKLKIYLDAMTVVADAEPLTAAAERVEQRLAAMARAIRHRLDV
jgi:phosphomannomutase